MEELLKPLHATSHRCFWHWTEPFLIYRANKSSPEELANAGQRYAERVADLSCADHRGCRRGPSTSISQSMNTRTRGAS